MEQPEPRIGDRERREVDERLRRAQDDGMITLAEYDERAQACYAARFRSELAPLTADLPDDGPPPAPPPGPPTVEQEPTWHDDTRVPEQRRHGRGLRGLVIAAVIGVAAVVAPGVLSANQGAAVFGSRVVQVAPGQTDVQVGVLFGSTKVVVPDDTQASTSGTTIFGSTRCDTACAPEPPGAPQVQVSGRGAFGSVEVLTAGEYAQDQDRRGRDD
ncbi:DUF1707 SHOCT-like domain-containing protein [Actinomycetospora soli]|uniref:DUF1707 SHOCT-like domain-containing protein n=1 Tax=Actinomycetospora soli TaxID=2893887 RepID=UPI001E2DB4CB|nr:DUF1707 domain-containing protein [Actinomycetospora soli]MCD2188372.1 DUF1707 domain-containing protein [Actinomycetospora soli]